MTAPSMIGTDGLTSSNRADLKRDLRELSFLEFAIEPVRLFMIRSPKRSWQVFRGM